MSKEQSEESVQVSTDANSPLNETESADEVTSVFRSVTDLVDALSDTEVGRLLSRLVPGVDPLALVNKPASAAAQNYQGTTIPAHLHSALLAPTTSQPSLTCEALLEKLRQALWSADFDGGVDTLNHFHWQTLIEKAGDCSIETKWMAAELFDYAGQYVDANEVLGKSGLGSAAVLAEALYASGRRKSVQVVGRHTCKQHSLLAVQWGFTFYRRHEYGKAKEIWHLARRFVEERLKADDYPCHGTLSRVFYGLGLVHRQLHEYIEARRMFRESVDHARQDAEWHKSADGGKGKALLEYRIAKCLGLGLGWVCYTDGSFDLARRLVNLARMLLVAKKAAMIKAYVDVVQAEIEMSEYGDQLPYLAQAIARLKKAYYVFTCHPAYRARTAHQLALASLRLSTLCPKPDKGQHLSEAKSYIEEVKKYGEGHRDRRWLANALIAESRLCRVLQKYEAAQRIAGLVLDQSEDDRFARIDALIELGQALIGSARERKDYAEAAKDYILALGYVEKAVTESCENPKIHAVCNLHLARCYLGLHLRSAAVNHVEKWRALSPRVKNAFVRRLGKEVGDELARYKPTLDVEWPTAPSKTPDVAKEEGWVRGWVTEVARNLTPPVRLIRYR
jgi:hypothetical protein